MRELLTGWLILLLIIAAFAIAGTMDRADDAAWRESWYERNGVAQWTQ